MNQKSYIKLSGLIFLIVGTAHIIRAISSWELLVNFWAIPVWLSWIAGAFILWLALTAHKLSK